jgi:hypothetical protein
MSYFKSTNTGDKIYRGAYTFSRNGVIYCEEEFEVFKDKRDMSVTFVSEQISRVSTGELLSIACVYRVNKKYIPTSVTVHRSLGTNTVIEDFIFDPLRTKIQYTFDNGTEEGHHQEEISTSPVFSIATPALCTSMVCLRSKKFDSTSKNYYSLLTSKNMWEFEESPSFQNVIIQKVSQATENLKIADSNLQAIQYKITESDPEDRSKVGTEEAHLKIWLSQHLTIPYVVRDDISKTKIEIKYLNNLDRD